LRTKVRRAAGRRPEPSAAILEPSVGQDDKKRCSLVYKLIFA
jgi:hypothetical protein